MDFRIGLSGGVLIGCLTLALGRGVLVAQTGVAATQPAVLGAGDLSDLPSGTAKAPDGANLTNLSLEDLMNVEVTSVSKQKQRIADAPAAVTVINQEDIDRSGMTTLPDLLRMAPGMNVGSLDANKWAIGSRGFTGYFSNTLLVQMDGRSVYTPQFAGVYWNAQDYVLEDLDRIEVIRGPGASIWGSNAVNGVVNITTKSADQTQGWLVSGLGGTGQQDGEIRYGGKIDDNTYYRVYTKYSNYDDGGTSGGGSAFDSWNSLQGGFRIDHYSGSTDTVTFQGDAYKQMLHQMDNWVNLSAPFQTIAEDSAYSDGANILGRWTHVISDTSSFSVQAYYDHLSHDDLTLRYQQDTGDVQFQHNFELGKRQEIIWGAGYRFYGTQTAGSSQIVFTPMDSDLQTISGFAQDDVTLVPERLHLFLGTKLELNSYTDLENEPSGRLLWTPDAHNTLWGAISRATRTPARVEEDGAIRFAAFPNGSGTTLIEATGNTALQSEELLAYELGYRFEPAKSFSIDTAVFFNHYDKVVGNAGGAPFVASSSPFVFEVPQQYNNLFNADTYGGEVEATLRATENWKLVASYAYVDGHQTDMAGNRTPIANNSPVHQVQLRSYLDVTKTVQLNTAVYYVTSQDLGTVPGYVRVDANIAWHPNEALELMVGVQNLLDHEHVETNLATFVVASEVERMFFARATYHF